MGWESWVWRTYLIPEWLRYYGGHFKVKRKAGRRQLRDKVTSKYHNTFAYRRYVSPQFIVEYADTLNKALESSQCFFTDIVKEGIKIYDNKEFKLVKPRELSFKEIKKFTIDEFETHYSRGNEYLDAGYYFNNKEQYIGGSLQ